MDAAIVTVGDELLVGDTENTNATWLCGRLADRGVTVRRVTVVPDEVAEIARVVNEYYAEYDAVLVTGGLGPTHDDVTMEAVAAAFGRDLVANDQAADWLAERGGTARTIWSPKRPTSRPTVDRSPMRRASRPAPSSSQSTFSPVFRRRWRRCSSRSSRSSKGPQPTPSSSTSTSRKASC